MPSLHLLRNLIERVPARLEQLPQAKAETKPAPTAWSPQEELGHLLDSAANNHQRVVRAQSEDNLAFPGYDQNRWVAINGYQRRDWKDLIEVWRAFNRQLLAAAESVPDSAWSNTLTVAASQPMTLEFVYDDYVAHMLHHLQHIGIDVSDIKSNTTNAA